MEKDIQVLFIDDEQSILDGIERLFRRETYGIVTTTSPEVAREYLRKHEIKVVVSDQRMPEIIGAKFLQEAKAIRPDSVRIIFTGYTDFTAAEEAINLGEVYRFISKPWKTEELLHTIRQSIEHYDLIADAKHKKEELEVTNKKLKALYEIQKEFTSTVSHELRTPLTSMKTAIDLVLKKMLGPLNKEQEEVLDRAKSNVDRLKRLIDDILDLTKIESGKLQMNFAFLPLNQIIQEAVDAQKDVAEKKKLYMKLELDKSINTVPVDKDRIIQVMNNLLSNALKFTKTGGLSIATINKPDNNHVVVQVKDTGKGIPEEHLAKIFEKFHQVESAEKNEEGGTGLGLAICREIVTRHGGKITVESKLNEGSIFTFVLPMQERRGG